MNVPLSIYPFSEQIVSCPNIEQHKRNCRAIMELGYLIGVTNNNLLDCKNSLKGTSQGKYWGSLFSFLQKQNRLCQEEDGVPEQVEEVLETGWGKTLKLICLRENDLQIIRPLSENLSLELCTFDNFDNAQIFESMKNMSHLKFKKGKKVTEIWDLLFKSTASITKRIDICDRYLADNLINKGKTSLKELLLLTAECSKRLEYLYIFTACPRNLSAIHVAKKLKKHVSETLQTQGKVLVIDDYSFGDIQHNRFIRFDCDVFDIGRGIEMFGNPTLEKNETINFARDKENQYSSIISEIESRSKKQVEKCCRMDI